MPNFKMFRAGCKSDLLPLSPQSSQILNKKSILQTHSVIKPKYIVLVDLTYCYYSYQKVDRCHSRYPKSPPNLFVLNDLLYIEKKIRTWTFTCGTMSMA